MIAIKDAQDVPAALHRLRAVERHAVDGSNVEKMTLGAYVLDVMADGQAVGAVAIKISADGQTATIRAAQCDGPAYASLDLIEDALQQRGVRQVGMFTKRAGLIRALQKRGYEIVSCELKKGI